MRRIHRERALLAGGGRALIMQLAHPAVAAGVAEHSDFPEGALRRLRRTLDLSLALVYGSPAEQESAAARIRAVHERVRGEGYEASDPRLLLWVHATLVDTTVIVYSRFVGTIPDAAQLRYYEESKEAARMLGIPDEHIPPTFPELDGYLEEMLAGDELRATPHSRALVRGVLRPPVNPALRPAVGLSRLLTLAMLPDRILELFDLDAGRLARGALTVSGKASRTLLPVVPQQLRAFRAARG